MQQRHVGRAEGADGESAYEHHLITRVHYIGSHQGGIHVIEHLFE
jgi:hypothetical protein